MSKINFQAIASSKGNTLDSIDMKRSYSPSKKFSQSFNLNIVTKSKENKVFTERKGSLNQFPKEFLVEFEVLEELGHGYQATVYRVKNLITMQYFAAKFYWHEDQKNTENIKKEIEINSILEHENIIKFYKSLYFQKENSFILLSHYVEYVSFKTFIKKTESELWNFNFYKPIIKQIINVVSYCHLNKITHGDFNHNNILICPVEKNIRIIDFGSSKKNSSTFGNLYSPSGNPKYRPPVEDFFFADSFQCECWSVGLVLMSLVLKDIITTKKVLHSKPKPCEKIQNLELDKTFVKVLNGLMLRGKDRYNIFEASKLLENVLSS